MCTVSFSANVSGLSLESFFFLPFLASSEWRGEGGGGRGEGGGGRGEGGRMD